MLVPPDSSARKRELLEAPHRRHFVGHNEVLFRHRFEGFFTVFVTFGRSMERRNIEVSYVRGNMRVVCTGEVNQSYTLPVTCCPRIVQSAHVTSSAIIKEVDSRSRGRSNAGSSRQVQGVVKTV